MSVRTRLSSYFLGTGASWSQFGEDAHVRSYFRGKTWSPTGGFGKLKPGFYVDVGCFHPIHLSNTRWLYREGWQGINIDPSPGVKRLFDRWRPRDVNLQLAISRQSGEVRFFTAGGRSNVLNTMDEDYAREMVARGMIGEVVPVLVKCASLASVLEQHLPAGRPIDLMSIDAEGHDLAVLMSNDWDRFRPEVLLVEVHVEDLDGLASSEVLGFMRKQGYSVHAWIRPTVMLVRRGT